MPFSLGAFEVFFVIALAIAAGLLYVRRNRYYRSGIVAVVCGTLAALLSPADIVSMVLLFVAFSGFFIFGSRFRLDPPVPTA